MKKLIAAIAVALALTGCAVSAKPVPPPVPAPTQPSTTPAVSPTTGPMQEYYLSAGRRTLIERDVLPASWMLAKALEEGTFGPAERAVYTSNGLRPWGAGMSGWGAVSWNYGSARQQDNPTIRVYATLSPEGSVVYKGVDLPRGLAVDLGKNDQWVQFILDQESGAYKVILSQRSDQENPVRISCVNDGNGCQNTANERPTMTLAELQQLDKDALVELNMAMVTMFGENWRKATPKG
jgi:hypothetical protein